MGCLVSKPAQEEPHENKAAVVHQQVGPHKATADVQSTPPVCNGKDVCQGEVVQAKKPAAAAAGNKQQESCTDAEPSCPLMVLYKDMPMPEAPLPDDEQQRFNQLCSYNILDTEPEESYDRISALCKTLFNVPIAMVTFVDKDRVWIKSVQGLSGLKQVERRKSLCAWALLSRYPEALVVPNLTQDVRFKDSPIVNDWPRARFYAACPLVNHSGSRLGTLCILDTKPREFSADSTTLLTQLANMVMREVERKRAMNDALCSAALRHNSGSSITHDTQAIMLVDMASPKWSIFLVNDAWQRVTGITQELAVGSHFWDLFEPPLPAQIQAYNLAIEQHRNFELRVPANVNASSSAFKDAHEALMRSNSGSTGHAGSVDSTSQSLAQHGSGGPQQGPMHGVRGWMSGNTDSSSQQQLQPAAAAVAGEAGSKQQLQEPQQQANAAVIAATAAATERTAQLHGDHASSSCRRSFGGGMRYIRFQFRSVASVGSHMTPAVSVPPALVSADRANYYWATVDVPTSGSLGDQDPQCSYTFGAQVNAQQQQQQHPHHHQQPRQHYPGSHPEPGLASGGSTCPSSSQYTVPSSDSSASLHAPLRTTFSLLPEDNPFQDITIGSLLGWGSYGRVHRGYWNGSLVAVKVLEQVAGDFNPRSNLEPLLHHRLSHPNIVAMFEVCTQEVDVCEDGRPLQEVWMVLEFCNRGTLSDAIQRGWLLTVQDGVMQTGNVNTLKALTTAREISGALEYLHSQNVLHGDLNGNNILLAGTPATPGGQDQRGFTAKVADFGLSRLLSPDNEQIITKTHGTITHMAPEVITEATHSKAADVYSFGVMLFELVSGMKPYVGMHYAQIVASITSGKLLQLLPEQASHLPASLKQLLAACLAANPAQRPSFQQVHTQLKEIEQQVIVEQPHLLQQQPLGEQRAQPLRQQQLQQQAAGSGTQPVTGAAAAAAAAAAVSAAASVAGSSVGAEGNALADIIAAAQQQRPPPGAVAG